MKLRFHPHPSRRRDATYKIGKINHNPVVSILIPPEEGMQPFGTIFVLFPGRWFQSSSLPKKGCNTNITNISHIISSFNPHPSRRRDATLTTPVSILSARFQSSSLPKKGCNFSQICRMIVRRKFQSSSLPKKGCNKESSAINLSLSRFQSSSLPKKGCNRL